MAVDKGWPFIAASVKYLYQQVGIGQMLKRRISGMHIQARAESFSVDEVCVSDFQNTARGRGLWPSIRSCGAAGLEIAAQQF